MEAEKSACQIICGLVNVFALLNYLSFRVKKFAAPRAEPFMAVDRKTGFLAEAMFAARCRSMIGAALRDYAAE